MKLHFPTQTKQKKQKEKPTNNNNEEEEGVGGEEEEEGGGRGGEEEEGGGGRGETNSPNSQLFKDSKSKLLVQITVCLCSMWAKH